jgi:hypothetical protein
METFDLGLSRIRRLVFTQRFIRLLLRAVWLGLAGFLIAWGLNVLIGPFFAALILVGAAVFAAPALIGAFRAVREERLAWRMDRLLGLQEQVTTALRVERAAGERGPVARALVAEAGGRLPDLHARISARGWYLRRDLEALALVLILLGGVLLTDRAGVQFSPAEAELAGLPVFGGAPSFADVFPSGIPGLTDAAPGGQDGNAGSAPPDATGEGLGEIANILADLGDELSEHPETSEIGEALEQGDLEGAAAAIERTADNVDLLPEDARQNMQEALRQAAQDARDAGQEDLADDLQAAADALENTDPDNPMAADALDELAESIRDLSEIFGSMGTPSNQSSENQEGPDVGSSSGESGSGSGAGTQGVLEPITRLEGVGEDFSIEGGDDPSGLLQPSGSGDPATSTSGGSVSAGGSTPTGTGTINSVLTPYSFPWYWRDVVADYFSP